MELTCFSPNLVTFDVNCSFLEFYRVLPAITRATGFPRVLPSFTGFHRMLRVSLGSIGIYWNELALVLTWVLFFKLLKNYLLLPAIYKNDWVSLGLIGILWECTRFE